MCRADDRAPADGRHVTTLRRLAFPLRLVAARLGAGGERALLVAVGVVAGAAVLAAVLAGRLVMQDRALAESTAQLAPADRVVQVAWSGAVDSFAQHDRFVAPRIRSVTGQEPARAMLFREASVQGRLVNLRAADDLGRFVRITSGRLPRDLRPAALRGAAARRPRADSVDAGAAADRGRPRVTPARRADRAVRAADAADRAGRPRRPLPHAAAVSGRDRKRRPGALAQRASYRPSIAPMRWVVDVRGADVHPWSIGEFGRKVQRLSAQVESNAAGEFQVTAPTVQLAAATSASDAAARRLLLLGGEGACLLLAFTILAAGALRRDVTDARRRLIWFGARRWQVELHTLAESVALATVGTIVGWVAGGAIAAAVAGEAGSPARAVIQHGLLSGRGLLAALCLAAAAGTLLYVTVRSRPVQFGRLAFTPLDAAAIGAVAVVLTGWARGSVDAQALSQRGGTSTFLLLVPALIVFAAAVVAARLLVPALRGIGRLGRRGPIALRLAAASLARNPGHAAIASTFLVASLGLALFAVSYRSTLLTGQRDEARYAVPASFLLSEDFDQLVPVLHGAKLSRYPTTPMQALRLTGNVPSGTTFTFLGLPSGSLAGIDGWRPDFAQRSLPSLASSLTPARPSRLRTTSLPPGRRFSLPVSVTGDDIGVRAIFRSPLGDFQAVGIGHTNGARTVTLRGRIPFDNATLAQLQFDVLNNGRITANAGTGIQPSAKGILSFGTAPRRRTPRAARVHALDRDGRRRRRPGAARLHPDDRPGRHVPARPADRRHRAARPRNAGRRRSGGAARHHPARDRGRADRGAHRRHGRPLPVRRGRRGRRRPSDGGDDPRHALAVGSARRTSSG